MQRNRTITPSRVRSGFIVALLASIFTGCASVSPGPDMSDSGSGAPISVAPESAPPQAALARADATARSAGTVPADSTGEAATRATAAATAANPPVPAGATVKIAPAPAIEVVAPAPPVETSLWDRIRAGFAMPELNTPLVAEKERFYLARPDYLQRMFTRGGRYLHYIVEEIEKRGLPMELALLPFVESAMNPVALSSAQAAGLWQFIPSTGKAYDLQQNWWVDNRRDVVKSTHAALDYLQKIYAMQGNDWFLALASYNWGEGAVGRAVKKNLARGRPGDYLSLDMPAETRHYVPKLIALKNILLRANELGVVLPDVPNKPYFVTIEKTRPIDLKLAAQFAKMTVDEFVALNPAHNRPVIAASKNNEIRLPADRRDAFVAAVEKHDEAQKVFASWQPYTLKPGETLESLAQRSGVAPAELQKANGLNENQRIIAGTRILVPHKVVEDESRVEKFVAPRVYEQVDKSAVYHTVGRKESLASIANRYGVSTATLAAWNGIKHGVKRGMRLLVQPPATQTLLTREDGDRSVVATSPKPGFMRVSLRADLPQQGDAASAAPRGKAESRPIASKKPANSGSRKQATPARAQNTSAPPRRARAAPRKPSMGERVRVRSKRAPHDRDRGDTLLQADSARRGGQS